MSTQHNGTLNENTIRIVAFLVAISAAVYLISDNITPFVLLTIDFAARAFGFKQYSILRFIADKLNNVLFNGIKKPIFAPPKMFAAKIGLLFSVSILILYFIGFQFAANILAAVLIAFALLESIGNICVACYLYSFMYRTGVMKS